MGEINIVELRVEAKHDAMKIKKGDKRYFPYIREDMIHLIIGELWEIKEANVKGKLES